MSLAWQEMLEEFVENLIEAQGLSLKEAWEAVRQMAEANLEALECRN